MKITKALIIAEPWIDYLLDGSKTWKMRSSRTTHRGWFGLIRKGSGEVHGIAKLVDIGAPLTPSQMIENFAYHRIPEHMILSGAVSKWNTPWMLSDIHRFKNPVSYRHKSGAVTWVELDATAIECIEIQTENLSYTPSGSRPVSQNHNDHQTRESEPTQKTSLPQERNLALHYKLSEGDGSPDFEWVNDAAIQATTDALTLGEIIITDGNISNNHIYLRSIFDRFPDDAVGGSNKHSIAEKSITVEWGGPEPVTTDLDGHKKFFRARSWIGSFFTLNDAQAGDTVVIEELGPYHYRVSLKRPVGMLAEGASELARPKSFFSLLVAQLLSVLGLNQTH